MANDQNIEMPIVTEEMQRRIRDVYQQEFMQIHAPKIKSRALNFWEFPYTDYAEELDIYDFTLFGGISDAKAAQLIGKRKWAAFKEAHAALPENFDRVFRDIENGRFLNDSGVEPLTVTQDDDGSIAVDITPVIDVIVSLKDDTLATDGMRFVSRQKLNDILTEVFREPVTFDEKRSKPVSFALIRDKYTYTQLFDDELNPAQDIEGYYLQAAFKNGSVNRAFLFDDYNFKLMFLYILVSKLNCSHAVEAIIHPKLIVPRKKRNTRATDISTSLDRFSRGMFRPGDSDAMKPLDYFNGDLDDNAIIYKKGTHVLATMKVRSLIEFDNASSGDLFNPLDGLLHYVTYSQAINETNTDENGYIKISSYDILSLAGIKNPWAKNSVNTMQRAYKSLFKLINNFQIVIDITEQAKRQGTEFDGRLSGAVQFAPLIDGRLNILRSTDGEFAFEVILSAKPGEAARAFPLASYSESMKQMLTFPRELLEFKNIRATLEHRCMFKYVWERASEKKTGNEILIDTLLINSLENPDEADPRTKSGYDKRRKLIIALEKMLDERQSDGILSWKWIDPGVKFSVSLVDGDKLQGGRKMLKSGNSKH